MAEDILLRAASRIVKYPIHSLPSTNSIYQANGYLDIPRILSTGYPFIFIIGGRGTGKTYNALTYPIDNDIRFIYMRRTQTQCDIVRTKEMSPYKKINSIEHWDITPANCGKQISGLYHLNEEGKPFGDPLGYMCALSTFSNLRGFDASDVELLIYDEFIPEPHERPIKEEANGFFNAVETISRNRELEGAMPLQCLLMANANYLGNPLFLELGLITRVDNMARNQNYEILELPERGILLIKFKDSEITLKKAQTALYKMVGKKSAFYGMSIGNDFNKEERSNQVSVSLKNLKPIVTVGELTIYVYKNNPDKFYITTHKSGTVKSTFSAGSIDRKRFLVQHRDLYRAYMLANVDFENYLCEIIWRKYLDIK